MNPKTINFRNYKLLKNEKFEFAADTNIYLVMGSNDKGKSTFLKGFLSILTAKDDTPVKVSKGELEGSVTLEFDHQGSPCIGKFDFSADKASFTLVSGALSTKKVSEIRDFFNYTPIVAEEFVKLGSNEKDRKVQRDIFLNLLPQASKDSLLASEALYKEAFEKRANANKDLATAKTMAGTGLTEDEQKTLDAKAEYELELENIEIKKQESFRMEKLRAEKKNTITSVENQLSQLDNDPGEMVVRNQIVANTARIGLLQSEIDKLTISNTGFQTELDRVSAENVEKINTLTESKVQLNKELIAIPIIEVNVGRAMEVNTILRSLSDLTAKANLMNANTAKLDILAKNVTDLDGLVKGHGAECKRILKEEIAEIHGVVVHSDGLYFKKGDIEVPFNEAQVGTAEIYKITIQILLQLNKTTPIIIMGRCESLDDHNLAIIDKMIDEYNKANGTNAFMVAEMVSRVESDIQFIAYEEIV